MYRRFFIALSFTLCGAVVLSIVPLILSEDVVVNTKYGAVKGKRVYTGKTSYLDKFHGIPFATPPIGSLRFQPPQPAKAWNGTREATAFPPACPQLGSNGSPLQYPVNEDCLYLNVYAPGPPSGKGLLPVMFWIHGGSYTTGTGVFYNGSALAKTGVVVVTINYRLQALGFLSTMDSSSGGNFGLLDQIEALKWVKDTIASFHGNPKDVTIFGESAGSGSVSLLLLSPVAKGLFTKAIMESGVSLSPWAVALPTDPVSPRQWAIQLGDKVDCGDATRDSGSSRRSVVRFHSSEDDALVDCLRKVSAMDLVHAAAEITKSGNDSVGIIFRPVVETIYGVVPDTPLKLLSQGAGSDVTSIRGVNKDEYSLFYLTTPLSKFTLTNMKEKILIGIGTFFPNETQAVVDKIIDQYITSKNFSTEEQLRQASIQIWTDFDFVVPTILELKYLLKNNAQSPQFLYQFTYRATHTNQPDWAGVEHGSELPFVFGLPFTHDKFFQRAYPFPWSSQDMVVSRNFIQMWTNFAKSGEPTPQPINGLIWWPYTMDQQLYLDIGSSLALHSRLEAERVQFWLSLINTYQGVWSFGY